MRFAKSRYTGKCKKRQCPVVNERVTAQGEVLLPLAEDAIVSIIEQLKAENVESVAVCLLFSFLYPRHEVEIRKRLLQAIPDLDISLSSEILPEYREYERTATTVINAYVVPLMARYLARLAEGVRPRRLAVMQSNGGIISAATAGKEAARTALSGPAGGVVGARFVASQAGFDDIITFDMGGTSTDVALCPNRLPTTSSGEIAGMPLRLPIIDIHTVGAGGGSLAYVDAGGALHVGPQSSGANPGPACYGRFTNEKYPGLGRATVTDANLVLGRLDADHFLGGEMRLDVAAAYDALQALAQKMGVESAETAALGVIDVANANMERAIRKISIERGFDPRRFTLVPFGGAGPLHACELAENMQIPRVFIPPVPGVLSAMGMLVAAPTKDYSQTVMQKVGGWESSLSEWVQMEYAPLLQRAIAEMSAEGHPANTIDLRYSLDMRYVGQAHELTIPYSAQLSDAAALVEAFHETHETRYGYRQGHAEVEIVTVRLTAVAPSQPPTMPQQAIIGTEVAGAKIGEKTVWFDNKPMQSSLYSREKLLPGHKFAGPAVVFQYDTTIVLPPGWRAEIDSYSNLLLSK
jgi:N-methylhydantoinase A